MSEIEKLARAAEEVAEAAGGRFGDAAARAERLAERLAHGRFHISVLGEFKRGKSTLINALLRADVLPTGVLPLTAVPTEVSYGEFHTTVVYLDGGRCDVELSELAEFVTEDRNPNNERKVARVEVQVPTPLLEPGVVLVDTPGTGSIRRHADDAANRAMLDAEGAILVLSADSPLSEAERGLLGVLAGRRAPAFFVLNKADHLRPSELDLVKRFVTDEMTRALGGKERLWCLSARAALDARIAGRSVGSSDAGDFTGFEAALAAFIKDHLVETRLATGRRELARIARELADDVALEAVAMALDVQSLERRVEEFRVAANEQRLSFEDERTLLERDVAALATDVADRLADFARGAPAQWLPRLEQVARTAPTRQLERELRRTVEEAVQVGFEALRRSEEGQVTASWSKLANRFRSRTEERVNRVRAAAADLLAVALPEVAIPEMAEEQERFFYLFLHVEGSAESIVRAMRYLLPPSIVRRRLLLHARAELSAQFDKHAGRARWDISQRLDAVRRRFESAMTTELDHTIESILSAARRAEEMRHSNEADRQRRTRDGDAIRQAALRVLSVTDPGRGWNEAPTSR